MLSKLWGKLPDKPHRAMWRNFMSSIGLLTVAMIAALYSSNAAREGRVVSSAIAALIALVIAIWVGIRFVPRLASSVDWDWLPFLSRYHVTREGWIYFGAITVVIFACVNTSNNLLYMVLSALLAVLLLSGFLSGLNFRCLNAELRIPATCFAGEPFPVSLRMRNEKRVFPTFSLHVEPADDSAFRFPAFYVPVVRAQQHVFQPGQAMLARRGRYVLTKAKASSRYPFGFFVKHKTYGIDAKCICYPEILPADRIHISVMDILGSNQRFERGLGNDLYTIRDYVPSDTARHVHWKASAKTAVLKTREYAAEESRRIILAFDRFGQLGDSGRFEHLVSETATLAFHLIQDGVEVSLVSDEWQTGYGTPDVLLESILHYLALVQMSALAPLPVADARDGAVVMSLR